MFLQIDGTFVLQIVNFAIFYAILYATFIKPVGAALAVRRAHIDDVAKERLTARTRAATLRAEAEATRGAARRDAAEALARDRAETQTIAAEIAAQSAARAQAIVGEARATIATELGEATSSEDRLATELAGTLLARAVGAGA